jgi:predicted DNA-binding transcriptional regulator AlpA
METTFDNLPKQIDYLISEVLVIKETLLQRIEKPEEVPKQLTLVEAIAFSLAKGITMSKSKLYKLTSSNKIPHRKAGNKLIFNSEEISNWCNNQIINPNEINQNYTLPIIKSALKKETNYGK